MLQLKKWQIILLNAETVKFCNRKPGNSVYGYCKYCGHSN
jgi:hypothetical protein